MHASADKQNQAAVAQNTEPAADEQQQDQAVHQRTSAAQGRAEFGGAAEVPHTTPWAQPIPVAITASTLRVRSAPDTSTSDTIVGRLHNGERVDTQGKQGDWLLVNHKGRMAFIHGRYAKPVEAPVQAPAASQTQEATAAPAPSTELSTQPQQQAASPEAAQAIAAAAQAIGVSLMAAMQWLAKVAPSCSDEEAGKQDEPPIPQGPQQQDVDAPVNQGSDPIKQEPTTPAQPKAPVVVPAGAAPLRDKEAAAFLAGLGNQQVNAAAHGVATLEQKFVALEDSQSQNEETGGGRDELVTEIGSVRGLIAAIDGAGLDAATAAQAKGRLYRAVQEINPYYSQGRNIDVLETASSTRTCNITSLAMTLESIGIDANAYSGNRSKVLAAAKCSPYAPRVSGAKHKVKEGGDWGRMAGLRLPDFLQLAAIAECASGTSEEAILAGAGEAWDKILSIYFLKTLASRFGVAGSIKAFTTDTSQSKDDSKKDLSALSGFGKKHRKDVEKLTDARNKAEESGSEKDQAAYQKLLGQEQDAMDGKGVETKLSIDEYKNAIIEQVGADLDSGKGVVVSISGHYVRLQSIHDTHVIVDDPGQTKRADRKVLWEEARAMGYFRHRLLLG